MREVERIRPASVERRPGGDTLIDVGSNVSGWLSIEGLSPETGLTLSHSEILDADGQATNQYLDPGVGAAHGLSAAARLRLQRQVVHPPPHHARLPVRGRRGVCPSRSRPSRSRRCWFTPTCVVPAGFACSDARVNAFHDAAVLSFRGNACDIPTDCPTRERSGWTGDWQVFSPAASFVYDVAGFSTKWLRDLACEQREDGRVPKLVPHPRRPDSDEDPMDLLDGSSGWGDAAVLVPWALYRAYGDLGILETQWDSMTGWVEFAARQARENRNAKRAEARPEAAEHEAFLWDTGYHWGEWLPADQEFTEGDPQPLRLHLRRRRGRCRDRLPHQVRRRSRPLCANSRQDEEVRRYEELAAGARRAWVAEFVGADGSVRPETQGEPAARARVRAGARDDPPKAGRATRRPDREGRPPPHHRILATPLIPSDACRGRGGSTSRMRCSCRTPSPAGS